MKKKLLALGLSAVLLMANGSLAFAEEYSAFPRWVACGNCEDGGLVESKKRISISSCSLNKCNHGYMAMDHNHTWLVEVKVQCNRCHIFYNYCTNEYESICGNSGVFCPF